MHLLERKTIKSRCYFGYIVLTLTLLLLLSDDQSYLPVVRRADCQLDAVSAVLSVVPVTSILTTAGLVGVNMAAVSRLLEMFGYDRSYLASGGAGTAAQPIGLQHNYAYNFPYVPGINISVKGDHDFSKGYYRAGNNGASFSASTPYSIDRKTYPSMMLPGEYENLRRYRGVDLSKILSKVIAGSGAMNRITATNMQQQVNDEQSSSQAKEVEPVSEFDTTRSASSAIDHPVRSQPTASIQSATAAAASDTVSQSGHQAGPSSIGSSLENNNIPMVRESIVDDGLRSKSGFGMPTANIGVHDLVKRSIARLPTKGVATNTQSLNEKKGTNKRGRYRRETSRAPRKPTRKSKKKHEHKKKRKSRVYVDNETDDGEILEFEIVTEPEKFSNWLAERTKYGDIMYDPVKSQYYTEPDKLASLIFSLSRNLR